MIYLTEKHKKKIVEHSKKEYPNEACGILAGKKGRVKKVYSVASTDKSAVRFFMDSGKQFMAMREIEKNGLEMIGIYHSHPEMQAYPSPHDVELAYYPEVSYVIVALTKKDNPDIKSFRIVNGIIAEEEVKMA